MKPNKNVVSINPRTQRAEPVQEPILSPIRRGRFALLGSAILFVSCLAQAQAQTQEPPPTAEQFRALQQKVLELEQLLKALTSSNAASQALPYAAAAPRLDQLNHKIEKIEQNQELAKEAEEERAKTAPKISLDERGFSFVSADENFKLRVRGYIQADGRFTLDDPANKFTDTFLLNRVRPVFEGTVFKNYDFKLMPDFGQGKAVIQDAYLDAHFLSWLNVRAGKYKAPVGLERLQSARDIVFVERSLPTDIAPNRDIGAWLHGDILKDVLGYEVGVANGATDGSSDDSDENDSKDVEGRLFAFPFKPSGIKPLEGLGIGVAGTTGHEDGTAPAYKTVGQQTFFSFNSGVTAQGDRSRISPQAYYYWGPFGLLGEYIVSYEDVRKGTLNKRLANSAWQVTASYVLTGEKASFTGVGPEHPFDPGHGQWGAFELAARVGQLDMDNDAFRNFGSAATPNLLADPTKSASQAFNWGIGLNWYLNRGVKLMLDYDQTHFEGGATRGDRPTEHALFSRIQVAF
ncbi:MAG TPA: porin [Verrucomicrobiae bacterium]|nr:porin [Verrucomicrobiae bacterium]